MYKIIFLKKKKIKNLNIVFVIKFIFVSDLFLNKYYVIKTI
ncbi:hypothetical protein [Candidatus Vidania fulgoroideorum]